MATGLSLIQRNVIANVAGSGWTVLMSLAFVPLYIHFLGIEGYGLIGIFLTLAALLSLLDLGLGTTLNREFARRAGQADSGAEMRDLLRTLEALYWAIGLAIGLAVVALAPVIAAHWVKPSALPREAVERAFMIMGAAIACQWPVTLYGGGLAGLQHQVLLNATQAAMATLRSVGGVFVLWRISDSIEAFLAWGVLVSLLHTLLAGVMLWRALPPAKSAARFRPRLLRQVWRFAAGITGISALAAILTQLDKVVLSNVLSLQAFGYYSLAWRVAGGLYYLVGPVGAAFFPRFSQIAARADPGELRRLYHRSCQLLSVVVWPIAVVLAFFAEDFLMLWTGSREIAANSSLLLTLLAIGTAVNGVLSLPVAVQLAHGWTRLVLSTNAAAIIVLAPLIYAMSIAYGGAGAAWAWIVLNAGYVLVMLPLMHRRVLRGDLGAWLVVDIGKPLAAALAVAGAWQLAGGLPAHRGWMLLGLAAVYLLAVLGAALAAPSTRELLVERVSRALKRRGGYA